MSLFPLLFIGTAALSHVYVFWTLRRAFGCGKWELPAFIVIILGLASVFLNRWFARLPWGGELTNASFLWLGLLFVLAIAILAGDLARGLGIAAAKLAKRSPPAFLAGPRYFRAVLLFGAVACAYSVFEARNVGVTRIEAVTPKLPAETKAFRIVAVSDVHLTRRGDEARLRRLVDLINKQKPDAVFMLGDLVDDWIADREELKAALRDIAAPAGKFAVLGNHEFYNGMEQSISFTLQSGFVLLRGESVAVGPIIAVGLDDPAMGERKGVAQALGDVDAETKFVALLTHRPENVDEYIGRFDLQLSGHTHGGQLFPARLMTWLSFRRSQGQNELTAPDGRKSLLYLTNGAGYWGTPVRFFAPPEIVVIDIVSS